MFEKIYNWFLNLFGVNLFRGQMISEEPTQLKKRKMYIVFDDDEPWYVCFKCPCGCGEAIRLSTVKEDRPRWSFELHRDNTITLAPSIWRNKGCKSHFFIKRGKVVPCHEPSI